MSTLARFVPEIVCPFLAILDSGGADQLIGRGDMLFTQGNELVRLQCGFVDTEEIEKITEIIGAQKGYSNAYLLPEFIDEEINNNEVNVEDRDPLFKEAAEVIVNAQQGSASLWTRAGGTRSEEEIADAAAKYVSQRKALHRAQV